MQTGDFHAAERACVRVLALDPTHADASFVAGLCALNDGKLSAALPLFETATESETGRADYWAHQARCLSLLGRHTDAVASANRARAYAPADALTFNTLGRAFTLTGHHNDALECYESAVRLAPDNPEFRHHLATGLTFCGELNRARSEFEQVLAIDPNHVMAHLALAESLDGPPPVGRVAQLETLLDRVRGIVDRELLVRQALARTYEAAGETASAFRHWEESKRAKKVAAGYTIDQDRALFEAVENLFDAQSKSEQRPGSPSNAPIFVIGLPRTGTTLTQQILSSHSAITAGGELSSLPQSVREAGGGRKGEILDPRTMRQALTADPRQIGDRYIELATTVIDSGTHFVDKLPLNFFFVGFIRRALPNAKIISLRRNALDTCLAGFRQLFAPAFRHYYYALTLEDSAEYYSQFTGLMAHWDSLYPGAIYHVQYEELVSDLDGEARRLFDHLELEYEGRVEDFFRSDAPVATASATQVRKPVHQESVGSWQRFATELAPLRNRLEELGINPAGGANPG